MNPLHKLNRLYAPPLTRTRIFFALAVAIAADGLQLCFGPAGWFLADQVIDVVAMLLTSRAIGFHVLLLPTFVVELIPVVEDMPTWTACTLTVVLLRKREQSAVPPVIAPPVTDQHAKLLL